MVCEIKREKKRRVFSVVEIKHSHQHYYFDVQFSHGFSFCHKKKHFLYSPIYGIWQTKIEYFTKTSHSNFRNNRTTMITIKNSSGCEGPSLTAVYRVNQMIPTKCLSQMKMANFILTSEILK